MVSESRSDVDEYQDRFKESIKKWFQFVWVLKKHDITIWWYIYRCIFV